MVTIESPRARRSARPAAASKKTRRIRESASDRALLVVIYLGLTLAVLVVLLPLLFILASSFSSPEAVTAGRVLLWPVDFTLKGYQTVLADPQVLLGYANSLFYMVAGTLISTTLTVCLAWPLSRRTFMGRNVIMGLPEELVEAASLDGSSDLRFLWSVVLPLSKPLIAVIALMYAIGQWNGFFDALLYLKSSDLFPLQLVLRNILVLNATNGGTNDLAAQAQNQELVNLLKYSLIVITSVPVLVIYPFVARYFNKGVLIGSVKG
ncbi:carbohydrate ABC transporter permease [Leifsonia sp. NPDC056665]|uniref:carbohydrate ABC transporter permease n=1 Tax=Leifsonia sp. NPDC056665 TaxID=3345901 RepID=UPI00369FA512